jgi:hypothetical protein
MDTYNFKQDNLILLYKKDYRIQIVRSLSLLSLPGTGPKITKKYLTWYWTGSTEVLSFVLFLHIVVHQPHCSTYPSAQTPYTPTNIDPPAIANKATVYTCP